MSDPSDEDRGERQCVRQVRRPELGKSCPERRWAGVFTKLRRLDLEHQQRDDNGEHPVAERFEPPGILKRRGHGYRSQPAAGSP